VAIESTELEVVPYPPYSPDLALSDFSLLAALKKHLRGVHFTCDKALPAAIGKLFKDKPEEFAAVGSNILFSTGSVILNRRYNTKDNGV
jgi:histone-lysine N-methyltransferase SETMAR